MRTPRLPAVDWTDAPADLDSSLSPKDEIWFARVPSHLKRTQTLYLVRTLKRVEPVSTPQIYLSHGV